MPVKQSLNSANNKPILITGSHRSGSTWVGRMIAESPLVGYIHEPFNIHHRPGICKAHFDDWFTYVCDNNASLYREDLASCLTFKYQLSEELKALRNPKDIARLLKDYVLFNSYRTLKKRALIKDPIAVFSTEWLAREFNMDVIVLIRHPAAFAGSLKKANWSYPFSHLLRQPLLIKHHLEEFEYQIEEFTREHKNIIDQAILLWNLIHHMIVKYKEKHPHWMFVKHEDLSADPIYGFSKIFCNLQLPYSKQVQNKIIKFSNLENLAATDNIGEIKRNSKANIKTWKNRLTEVEIKRIRESTNNISNKFYNESDWA